RRVRPVLFKLAARTWLAGKSTEVCDKTLKSYTDHVGALVAMFGNRLVTDIGSDDIAALQARRRRAGLWGGSITMEVGGLRQVLRKHRVWAAIADDVTWLGERKDIGRAISRGDEEKLLAAVRQSPSPALLPLFLVSIDTGLRASEVRALR